MPYNDNGATYNKDTNVFTDELRQSRDTQWLAFSHILGEKELAKLDLAGVFYRVPTVGAKIESGILLANTAIKGLPIEYRINNGKWQNYNQAIKVKGIVQVRARTRDRQRAGRTMTVTK